MQAATVAAVALLCALPMTSQFRHTLGPAAIDLNSGLPELFANRRATSVVFTVGVYSVDSDSADTIVSTLRSYMSSTTFATDLVATGGGVAPAASPVL